jgi:hypothetical protein
MTSLETIGWTPAEESAFGQIMAASDLGRFPAIRLYRRCKDNLAKALQIAEGCYGMSDTQRAAYHQNKVARVVGLAKAREARRLKGSIQQRNRGASAISAPGRLQIGK